MKTRELYQLAEQIQKNPTSAKDTLLSYKSEEKVFEEFIHNLRAPAEILPRLIEVFAARIEGVTMQEFGDLKDIGTLFCTLDGATYKFAGELGGVRYASPSNSNLLEVMDAKTPIKWIF